MKKINQIKGNGPDVAGLQFEMGAKVSVTRRSRQPCIVLNLLRTFPSADEHPPSPPAPSAKQKQPNAEQKSTSNESLWMWHYGVDVEGLVTAQTADLHRRSSEANSQFASTSDQLDLPETLNNLENEKDAMENGVAEMLCAATKTFLTNIIEVKRECSNIYANISVYIISDAMPCERAHTPSYLANHKFCRIPPHCDPCMLR